LLPLGRTKASEPLVIGALLGDAVGGRSEGASSGNSGSGGGSSDARRGAPTLLGKAASIAGDGGGGDRATQYLGRLVRNASADATVIKIEGRAFVVPGASSFICAQLRPGARLLREIGHKFDLVVADPPWENKSARRFGG
jgi:hypothetical protein